MKLLYTRINVSSRSGFLCPNNTFLLVSTNNQSENDSTEKKTEASSRPAPRQEELSKELATMKSQFYNLQSLENTGLSLVSHQEVNSLKRKIIETEKAQKRLKSKATYQKGYRDRKNEDIKKLRLVLNICYEIFMLWTITLKKTWLKSHLFSSLSSFDYLPNLKHLLVSSMKGRWFPPLNVFIFMHRYSNIG